MKKSIFLTVFLAAFFVSTGFALEPGDTLWTRTYGGATTEYGYSVQQTTDGGYIVAGQTNSFGAGGWDIWLLKTDANGDTLWTRLYGGSSVDNGFCVQQTPDNGYIIAGATMSFGAGLFDVYLVKTDNNGNTLWSRTYGGSSLDLGHFVRQTRDGGYILAGETMSFGAGSADFWLLKLDAFGDTLWTRTYGGSLIDQAWCVERTSDDGYIVVGHTDSFGDRDFYLVKTDANGDTLWTRNYGGSGNDLARSVQQSPDGGYIVAGITASFGAGGLDVWLVKTDANGDSLWTRTYGGSESDYAESVQLTIDGGYIVTGYTASFGAGGDVWLLKTDATGDTLWTRTYGGSNPDYGQCVQQTTDGGYIIAGYGTVASYYDVYLVRVAGEELPAVSIEIVPDNPPVTVPQGGRFGFTGTLINNTEETQVTDAWTMAIGPQKDVYGPFKEFSDLALAPYETRSAHFYQRVPNLAPLGFYDYIAYCGDYPSGVIDSSCFQIEVVEGVFTGGEDLGWLLSGSFDRGEDISDVPSEFALLANYPNPFNARTVISYQLPSAREVKLEVYNLIGSKVTTLVDAHQEAGYRSVTWDASEVSSGIYFYKLSAGDYTEAKKMILVK